VLLKVFDDRLSNYYERGDTVQENQRGFKLQRWTHDIMTVVHRFEQPAPVKSTPPYMSFVYHVKAYD
ncbi:MAG: hypothetical protein ABJX82_18790, partial [Paracoccaceae bacterium]